MSRLYVKRRQGFVAGVAALAIALGGPASVAAEAPEWPIRLRQDLARLAEVEWRLSEAAGSGCPLNQPDAGLVIDDRRAYLKSDWPALKRSVGLGDAPVVAALAQGGPAKRAGLAAGDVIVSIDGNPVETLIGKSGPDTVPDAVGAAIVNRSAGQPVRLAVRRGADEKVFDFIPVVNCAARFVLKTSRSIDAHSDAENIAVTSGLMAFSRTDDELALIAGHELAHVILRHRKSAGFAERRRMEDDADIEGARLAQCAGYDPAAATAFFDRYAGKDVLSFLRAPTHRSFRERAKRIRAVVVGLRC